jgi:hypothetical protein
MRLARNLFSTRHNPFYRHKKNSQDFLSVDCRSRGCGFEPRRPRFMREKQGFGLTVYRSKNLSLGVRVMGFGWLKSFACVPTFSGKSKGFSLHASQRANTTTATTSTAAAYQARSNDSSRSPNRDNRQRGASCRYEVALRPTKKPSSTKHRLSCSGSNATHSNFARRCCLRSITLAFPAAFDSKGVWK